MNWKHLTNEDQLNDIIITSANRPQVIFKHSTSCSISRTALHRMEKITDTAVIDFYYLDLWVYRPISNKVAEIFKVYHESPQVLLIKSGECVYEESHLGITVDELLEQAGSNN